MISHSKYQSVQACNLLEESRMFLRCLCFQKVDQNDRLGKLANYNSKMKDCGQSLLDVPMDQVELILGRCM